MTEQTPHEIVDGREECGECGEYVDYFEADGEGARVAMPCGHVHDDVTIVYAGGSSSDLVDDGPNPNERPR